MEDDIYAWLDEMCAEETAELEYLVDAITDRLYDAKNASTLRTILDFVDNLIY